MHEEVVETACLAFLVLIRVPFFSPPSPNDMVSE